MEGMDHINYSKEIKKKYIELKKIYQRDKAVEGESFERMLQKLYDNDFANDCSSEFLSAYRDFLLLLSDDNQLESFLSMLKKIDKCGAKQSKESTKNDGTDNSPRARFPKVKDWDDYKDNILQSIKNSDVLEGEKEPYCVTYTQVKGDGFYNVNIGNGRECILSEEFIKSNWAARGYRCEFITGELGSGKSLLVYRVAEYLLEKNKSKKIIFISIRMSEEDRKRSLLFVRMFLSKNLIKRGKFIVIIDGLDELLEQRIIPNFSKLFEAAKYYKATLLINCRKDLWYRIKEDYPNTGSKLWKTSKLDTRDENLIKDLETLQLSSEVIDEIMQSPHLRFWVNKMLVFDRKEAGTKRISKISNDYLFMNELFERLKKREARKYILYPEYWSDVRWFLQKAAVALHYYGGEVSIAGCIGMADMDRCKKLLTTSFVNEMLELDLLDDEFENSRISAFRCRAMANYFLMEEICYRLQKGEFDILSQLDFADERLQTMKQEALKALSADVKEKTVQMLNAELKKDTLLDTVRSEMLFIVSVLSERE